MKKVIVINAGPRKGFNTDLLIKEAAKGAESAGNEIEYISLFDLEAYTGCISCFRCKRTDTYGICMHKDGLTAILDKIRNSDGLIIGSPNYLSNMTASFRALYERLVFQVLTYNREEPCCNKHKIPVLFVTTSNCAEEMYDAIGYTSMLESYKQTLSNFVGPTEMLICGNTLQVNDYSRYNWTMFNPDAKKKYHDDTFDSYLQKAYIAGKGLV